MLPFFPYTNFHELNADWILKTVKNLADAVSQFADNLAHVVRVTAQTFTADEQRIACGNIKAVSYHTQSTSAADRTTARANLQAVGYEAQTLTETQQTAARENIGAASASDIPDVSDVVRYSAQVTTEAQKRTARENIGAIDDNVVRQIITDTAPVSYTAQALTAAEQAQARANIGASQAGTVPAGAVRYDVAQTLTEPQKAQARENIGANSGSASDDYVFVVSEDEHGTGYEVTGNLSDAAQVTGRVFIVLEQSGRTREALAELTYSGGTLTRVSASLADFFTVDSTIPNTITQVIITNSGATVTDIQQRQVPVPAPLGADAGKVLAATRNGVAWVNPVFTVTFSGSDDNSDSACNVSLQSIIMALNQGAVVLVNYIGTGAYSAVRIYNLEYTKDENGISLSRIDNFGLELSIIYTENGLNIGIASYDIRTPSDASKSPTTNEVRG